MSRFSSALAALAIVFAASSTIPASANLATRSEQEPVQAPLKIPPFDGVWEGLIFFDKEAFLAPTSTPAEGEPMRIEIHGAVVRVFAKEGSDFKEAKPGLFHIAPVSTNAVIFATQDEAVSSGWVESWVFVVTRKDEHTLIVEYSRLVNNVETPPSDPESKFATRGAGEFKLVSEF
ncbi:MAG TPA: hypothetical protein VMD53_07375 [Rhizomicrobium sp.]|nr:hypothetical protein [Rhizomicrobium sp.]